MKSARTLALVSMLSVSLAAGVANAQDAPAKSDRPWAKGVTKENQAKALQLFDEGNRQFGTQSYRVALATYKKALAFWDHPAIRFNIAESLIHLDQLVEAFENIKLALRYGPSALDKDDYERALTNKKLLEGQLVQFKVTVKEKGARVSLDGAPLFTAPGEAERVLKPGAHQLVIIKDGRQTETRDLTLLPGKPEVVTVDSMLLPGEVKMVRRWSAWKPWAVVGGGAAVALGGLGLRLLAGKHADDYGEAIATECPTGCTPDMISQSTKDLESKAELESVIGISMMVAGGAVLAAGVALVLMNQPQRVEQEPRAGGVRVVGGIVPGGGEVGVRIDF